MKLSCKTAGSRAIVSNKAIFTFRHIHILLLLLVCGSTDRALAAAATLQATITQSTPQSQYALRNVQAAVQMGAPARLNVDSESADARRSQSRGSSSSGTRTLQAWQRQQQQQQQQRVQVPRAPEWLLAKGFKGLAPPVLKNWRRFADKVNTPGSNITLVTFGGSITCEALIASNALSWVKPAMRACAALLA
jgi:hypothetical protein